MDYIIALEEALETTVKIEILPIQPRDLPDTYTDVEDLVKEWGYKPCTIKEGVQNVVKLYHDYHTL